jgi:hypothetical protein
MRAPCNGTLTMCACLCSRVDLASFNMDCLSRTKAQELIGRFVHESTKEHKCVRGCGGGVMRKCVCVCVCVCVFVYVCVCVITATPSASSVTLTDRGKMVFGRLVLPRLSAGAGVIRGKRRSDKRRRRVMSSRHT